MTLNPNFDSLLNEAQNAATTTGHGFLFEYISTYALTRGPSFGPTIKTIERWVDWAARERPNLPRRMLADVGVDQIITTHTGDVWAVQNKGRTGEASRGSFPDFTNFEAQASLAGATRLLWVTSSSGLNGTATDYIRARTSLDVVVLNRQWLADELEYPDRIAKVRLAIEAQAEGAPGVPNILRFDQHTALNCLDAALETHNSIQYISACGTGKTTVAHALHDRRDSRLTAFFVPTLGLMKQTIKAWKDQAGSRPFTTIAVCSDDTVVKSAKERMREDHWETPAGDLGESLIRDPEALARKISASARSDHPVVLFVTYQSAQIVVDAQYQFGAPDIDLVIADEAHYLAGSSEFGEVVKDKAGPRLRIRASKRVYATATPRTVSAKDRGLGIDSMDEDSPVFGPRAFTMMMGDGIQLGILNGYRISMLAVPDDTVDDIREGRVLRTANGSVEARYLAAVHGVGAAMTESENLYVSYHSSVKRAKLFAGMCIEEGVATFAEPIWGLQNAGRRSVLVDKFKKSTAPSILTNVRCLTEGVDIPKLNGLIFVDPKINPADIGQAVGRSLRLHKDKTTLANIILPIPVPRSVMEGGLDATKIAALIRADGRWKNLYKVIDALGEHDTNVGANIEVVMKRWGVTGDGRSGPYTDRVTLPPAAAGAGFRDRIISGLTLAVQRQVEGEFLATYTAVQEWLDTNDRRPSATATDADERSVHSFLTDEMHAYFVGSQSEARTAYMEKLAVWGDLTAARRQMMQVSAVKHFQSSRSRLPSLRSSDPDERDLAAWLDVERAAHAAGETETVTAIALGKVKDVWVAAELSPWQRQATSIGEFMAAHGRSPQMTAADASERAAAAWLFAHRTGAAAGMLPAAERSYLDDVASGWDVIAAAA